MSRRSDGLFQKKTLAGEKIRENRRGQPRYLSMYPKSYTDSMVYGQRRDLMRGILSFTVLNERLLVKELTEDWVTKAGLIIPEHLRAEEEYFSWGLVLQVGERVTEDVVAGDRILFEPLTGVPNGEGALFVWQRYVWAVIEDDPEVEA